MKKGHLFIFLILLSIGLVSGVETRVNLVYSNGLEFENNEETLEITYFLSSGENLTRIIKSSETDYLNPENDSIAFIEISKDKNILSRINMQNYDANQNHIISIYLGESHDLKENYFFQSAQPPFPESYEIDYSIYPTTVLAYYYYTSAQTVPVLMIHGLHGSDKINQTNPSTLRYWNDIPIQLRNLGNDPWTLYFIPANLSVFLTSGILKNEIDSMLNHYFKISKIDVVGHSMGGLVAMGYIQGLGKNQLGNPVPYSNNIRKFIAIGTPFHGSYLSNRVLLKLNATNPNCEFAGFFGDYPSDKDAQSYLDLAIASEFTYLLNKNPLNDEIDYLAITGNSGIECIWDETLESSSEPGSGNDGFVSVSSASLLDKGVPLVILGNYNHINEAGAGISILPFNPQKISKTIDSFLKSSPIILSQEGDYYINPENKSPNPFNKGSLTIKTDSSVNSISIKNRNNEMYHLTEFSDLRHNTETNNWYYFSDNNPDIFYSDDNKDASYSRYGTTLSKGEYQIYVNKHPTNSYLEIKPAETIVLDLFDYEILPCVPEWVLNENWTDCQTDDFQYKDWRDVNECEDSLKPKQLKQKCNYCSSEIQSFYFSSGCINKTITKTLYYLDLNFESCCRITNLSSDCEIFNAKYANMSSYKPCTPLKIEVKSPVSTNYYSTVPLAIYTNKKLTILEYIDYSEKKPYFKKLCSNCYNYIGYKPFSVGNHSIEIRAISSDQNLSVKVDFSVSNFNFPFLKNKWNMQN